MTVTAKALIEGTTLTDAQATYYTATNCRTIIDKFTATNYSSNTVTVSVNLVASGGEYGNANLVKKTKSLAAAETYTFPEVVGQILNSGDAISLVASAADSVNVRVSGREIT